VRGTSHELNRLLDEPGSYLENSFLRELFSNEIVQKNEQGLAAVSGFYEITQHGSGYTGACRRFCGRTYPLPVYTGFLHCY
jgi:hypothetical protein